MIDISTALYLANEQYPFGPERIAETIGVRVDYSVLVGTEGWCVRRGGEAIIRINKNAATVRQRFTLAHELAHLILGTSPDVLSAPLGDGRIHRDSEKAANSLAAEMLLPTSRLVSLAKSPPFDIYVIRQLAKQANVSEIVAARRLADHAEEMGLIDAGIIEFVDGLYSSNWSKTLHISQAKALELMASAAEKQPALHREPAGISRTFAAIAIKWDEKFSYLFVQVIGNEKAFDVAEGEEIRELEIWLYDRLETFRMKLNGCFGAFKPKAVNLDIDEATEQFYARYTIKWDEATKTRMLDPRGQRYVYLRLKPYCLKQL